MKTSWTADKIRTYRKKWGMTQDQLAIALKLSHRSRISNWETGKYQPSRTSINGLEALRMKFEKEGIL